MHDPPRRFQFRDTREFFVLAWEVCMAGVGRRQVRWATRKVEELREEIDGVDEWLWEEYLPQLREYQTQLTDGGPEESAQAYRQYYIMLLHDLPMYVHSVPDGVHSAILSKLLSRIVSPDVLGYAVQIALALALPVDEGGLDGFLPLIPAILDIYVQQGDIAHYPRILIPSLLLLCRLTQHERARREALAADGAVKSLLSLAVNVKLLTLYRLSLIVNVLEKLSYQEAGFAAACAGLVPHWSRAVALLNCLPNKRDGQTELAQQGLLNALRPALSEMTGFEVATFFDIWAVRKSGVVALAALHGHALPPHATEAESESYRAWRGRFEALQDGAPAHRTAEWERVFKQLVAAADFACDALTAGNGARLVNQALDSAQWAELLRGRCSLPQITWIKRLARRAQAHLTDDDSGIQMSMVTAFFERQSLSEHSDHSKASLLQCMSDMLRCVRSYALDYALVRPLRAAVETEALRLGVEIIEPCAHVLECLLQSPYCADEAASLLITVLAAIRKTQQWHMYDVPAQSAQTLLDTDMHTLRRDVIATILTELVQAHGVMLRAAGKLCVLRVLHKAYHASPTYRDVIAAGVAAARGAAAALTVEAVRAGVPRPPLAFAPDPRRHV
eukprot:TRINITY_DN2753_c0_g2_i2.p1 TRINITY_DN2753_c0_g2~~TRINITY_DN2753_c0_g2_i2.p1  ORF type:complete len:683 (+),score=246.73 TRINITY_DN2753_c0_g2_i2:197-2050(+)